MSEMSEHVSGKGYIPDPAGWGWVRVVMDHNPCFLLSALLMFVGVFLLNAARDVNAAEMGKLLGVLGAVNVYEVALIGLAYLLVRKFGMEGRYRDPVLLLLIGMLFLADGGFLTNEAVQTDGRWGWVVNVVLLVLAAGKGMAAMRAVGIGWRVRTAGFLGLQLGLLYGLPIWLSRVAVAGEVSAGAMYGAWWAVGMLPAVYDLAAGRRAAAEGVSGRREFLRRGYVVLPWVMLVAHLGFFHYVYRAEFYLADLAPVMLGLAAATRRVRGTRLVPAGHLAFFRWALPAVAVLLAMTAPGGALVVSVFGRAVSQVLITAGMAMVMYGYFVSWHAAAYAVAGIVLMAVGHAAWPTAKGILRAGAEGGGKAVQWSTGLLPTTATGWGMCAVAGAFVLLGVGAVGSLRKAPNHPSMIPEASKYGD